jgi:hypothetical protein
VKFRMILECDPKAQGYSGVCLSVPLTWSWRLIGATPQRRTRFEIVGSGSGIRRPELDEDMSVEGMLHGVPAILPIALKGCLVRQLDV